MRLRKEEFKTFPIVYQRHQDGRCDLPHTNQIIKLLSKQLKPQLPLSSPFNSFISMSILPALSRLSKTPINEKPNIIQTPNFMYKGKDKLNKAVSLVCLVLFSFSISKGKDKLNKAVKLLNITPSLKVVDEA